MITITIGEASGSGYLTQEVLKVIEVGAQSGILVCASIFPGVTRPEKRC
jgi:hypothetical protein